MKKLLLLVFAALAVASCEKDDGLKLNYEEFSSPQSSWTLDQDGGFYYTVWSTRILDRTVFERGQVLVYVYDGDRQVILPSVRHLSEIQNGQLIFYTQTIDFEIAPGEIRLFVTNSDFQYGDRPDLRFRAVYIR